MCLLQAPKSFLNLPDLPPLPRLPALPTLEEIKKKYSLDALSDNLDGWFQHLSSIRTSFQTLQAELERAPGSLYANVVKAAQDIKLHPELEWDAEVRLGTELSRQERAFLRNRKEAMVEAFAKLMDVAAEEVDPRDIPVVAVAGSGGGYRAMVSTLGNLKGAKELGVWDVVSYASAVSGTSLCSWRRSGNGADAELRCRRKLLGAELALLYRRRRHGQGDRACQAPDYGAIPGSFDARAAHEEADKRGAFHSSSRSSLVLTRFFSVPPRRLNPQRVEQDWRSLPVRLFFSQPHRPAH